MECFFEIFLAAFMNAYDMKTGSLGDFTNSTLTVVALCVCFNLPLFVLVVFLEQRTKSEEEKKEFWRKYGVFFEGVDTKKYGAILVCTVFFLRRLAFVLIAGLMTNQPLLQIILILLIQFSVLTYIGKYMPYDNKISNRIEIFNELCISFFLVYVFTFQNEALEGPTRIKMGYFAISLIIFNMIVNFIMCLWRTGYELYLRGLKLLNQFRGYRMRLQKKVGSLTCLEKLIRGKIQEGGEML